jgi:hypothetical protein
VWLFSQDRWSIIDANTGAELENEYAGANNVLNGFRGGDYPAGSCILPLKGSNPTVAYYAIFGGASATTWTQMALDDVAWFPLMAPVGQKTWILDPQDKMPYGRFITDAVLQPNGKVLLLNGAMGGVNLEGQPYETMYGAALGMSYLLFDSTPSHE